MEKDEALGADRAKRATMMPTGGVDLDEERLRILASQWEGTYRSLRRMDELSLGEKEPATLFIWRLEGR